MNSIIRKIFASQKSKISGNLEMSEKQSFSEHSQKSSIFDDSKNFQSKKENMESNIAIKREINQGDGIVLPTRKINPMEKDIMEYKKIQELQNKIMEQRNNIALTKGVIPDIKKRQFIKTGILGIIAGIGIAVFSKIANARYFFSDGTSQSAAAMSDLVDDASPQLGADLDTNSYNVVSDSGKGIDFSATSDAAGMSSELLDDYEEGTWTANIADDTLNGTSEGQGYTLEIGTYTKIGNRVLYSYRITMSDLGTMTTSQQASIVGLPFTSSSSSNTNNASFVGQGAALAIPNAGEHPGGQVPAGATSIKLDLWDATTGQTSFLISEISADGQLLGQGHYHV